jgi:hypothetical protein
VALLVGAGLGYYLAARRERRADERAATAEAELNAYRDNVTDHFRETAVHFRALGEQYRSLHEHLAQGAESLCETRRDEERLSFSPLAEIEGPAAGAGDEPAAHETGGEVIDSAADATSQATPPVDYELPGAAEPATESRAAGGDAAAPERGAEAAAESQSTDETRAGQASASTDAEAAQAERLPRTAEGDEPDIAVTPAEPDPARAGDEAPRRTIH